MHAYDELVLATGSSAAMPPIPGNDLPGVFVYRTIDDVAALRGWVEQKRRSYPEGKPVRGAVIGGGLLGLEAAGALTALDAQATVIEFGTHLMGVQVDLGGGHALKRLINGKGIGVRAETATSQMKPHRRTGHVGRLDFADGGRLDVDVVVVATGVRPRDELARAAGLPVGERGGVVVDLSCRTEDPHIWAVGEVACIEGALHRPGRPRQRDGRGGRGPAARRPRGVPRRGHRHQAQALRRRRRVASATRSRPRPRTPLEVVWADPVAGVYKKLVLSDDARTLLGGVFVGDAGPYASLRPMLGRRAAGRRPERLPAARGRRWRPRPGAARRRHRVLLQQRLGRHDPGRRHRARVHRRPRR